MCYVYSDVRNTLKMIIKMDKIDTLKIVDEIVENPLPPIVISDNFGGNGPAISCRKSDAVIGLWFDFTSVASVEWRILWGSCESIHNVRRFDNWFKAVGILKSATFGYVDIRSERRVVDLPKAPLYSHD